MRVRLALFCLLTFATSASAEVNRMTDSQGREWVQDGATTCVSISATFAICGRTMPPEPGKQMTMQPTHDCSRPTATDAWACQSRGGWESLTAEQQQTLLLLLMNRGQLPVNPGLEAGRNVLRSLCLSGGGTIDPATGACYTPSPPPRLPLNCFTTRMGSGWNTVCQ